MDVAVTLQRDGADLSDTNPLPSHDTATATQVQAAVARLVEIAGRLAGTLSVAGAVDTGGLTDAELRAAPVDVVDDYAAVDHLADQVGGDGVLTFLAAAPGALVWVDVDPVDPADTFGYRCRATVDGTLPTAASGWVCRPGPNPIPVPMAGNAVKVWAPAGVVVAVQVVARG